jgi:hypothetical protein
MAEEDATGVTGNLATLRQRIQAAVRRAGRAESEIRLVAVTKTVPTDRIEEAIRAGCTEFGENYVQEAETKLPLVGVSATWHFLGHLQSNKAKRAVALFSCIQSVDRLTLATALNRHAGETAKPLRVLVEVNMSEQAHRSGVLPSETLALCEQVARLPHLHLEGLMGIAPHPSEGEARPYFARLRRLFEQLPEANRQTLSMGMSNDFEVAIEEGATLIRIGTALFGKRPV